MSRRLWIGACALVLLAAGCDSKWGAQFPQHGATALTSSARPVGPIPGPGDAAPPPENPLADDAQAAWAGRTLFVRFNCSGCHGGRAGGGMGPSLRDKVWIYGGRAVDIYDSIAEGRAHGMPAWGTRLPEQQVWQLVTYIQSLRTDHEPEAPK